MIDYVPLDQANIHNPAAYVYVVDERGEKAQANSPISDEEIDDFAQQLTGVFADGFQWSDISDMVHLCLEYLDEVRMSTLHGKEKQSSKS